MAVASYWSSSAMVKAVLLPLILLVLAVAAVASSSEDGPAVAKSGGRFSETPVGRKLLAFPINFCGLGSAPDYGCKMLLGPLAKHPTCCPDAKNITQGCWDVGAFNMFKCGSCNTMCKFGEVCCSGVCADLKTSKNNCGLCGNGCRGSLNCTNSLCGY